MNYAIITGASKGIGKALAEHCAASGQNLILISLPGEHLDEVSEQISNEYHVDVHSHEADLTEEGAIEDFFNWCKHGGFSVDMLVNNAGMGMQGAFVDSDQKSFRSMMQLNMDVVTSMTWHALPYLQEHSQSYILNVGSIASYLSVPYKALYTASKGFVLTFSNALYYELKETPVQVSCVCPGPTLTTQTRADQVRKMGWKANILVKNPEQVARTAIEGLKKGKRTIIPGFANKVIVGLGKYLPTDMQLKIADRLFADSEFNEKHINSSNQASVQVEAE